jgi:hypothetical protein
MQPDMAGGFETVGQQRIMRITLTTAAETAPPAESVPNGNNGSCECSGWPQPRQRPGGNRTGWRFSHSMMQQSKASTFLSGRLMEMSAAYARCTR